MTSTEIHGADKTPDSEVWKQHLAEKVKHARPISLVGEAIAPLSKDIEETIRIVTEEIQNRVKNGLTHMDKEDLLDGVTSGRDLLNGMQPGMAGTGAYLKHKDKFLAYLDQVEEMVKTTEEIE